MWFGGGGGGCEEFEFCRHLQGFAGSREGLILGGSWVVISGVVSPLI